jgi:leucyl aminopeptidase
VPATPPVLRPAAPELRLVTSVGDVDVLVVGIATAGTDSSGATGPVLLGEDVLEGTDLLADLTAVGATGTAGQLTRVPTRGALGATSVLAVGLGALDGEPSDEQVRRAAGVAARSLAGTTTAATTLSGLDLGAAVEGFVLGSYAFTAYKSDTGTAPVAAVELLVPDVAAGAAALTRASAVARAVTTARELVNTPSNDLFPASFAERASALGTEAGLAVEVLDEDALAAGGYGGILGVGQGSSRPPRLVRLSYSGGGTATVGLVGKGITFDTGGISIKPAAGMEDMTSDMAGAAAVVATMVLVAELGLPLTVTATVPMAENMPSATAQRPGDVLTQYGGTTVAVLNTDAEGRLILADAMVRACEDGIDYLIDTATLTGAQVVALGNRTPGVLGTDAFRDRVAAISRSVGEGGWAMPMPDELRAELDSPVADLQNITNSRAGGMLAAAVFLREFVAEGVQWAHVDVAGPAYNTGAVHGYTGKGGTGVPVRTMFAVLEDIAANG